MIDLLVQVRSILFFCVGALYWFSNYIRESRIVLSNSDGSPGFVTDCKEKIADPLESVDVTQFESAELWRWSGYFAAIC